MSKLSLDVYVDGDFLGLYGHEDRNDHEDVRVVLDTMLLNNCP
jgi:hypothetical protein